MDLAKYQEDSDDEKSTMSRSSSFYNSEHELDLDDLSMPNQNLYLGLNKCWGQEDDDEFESGLEFPVHLKTFSKYLTPPITAPGTPDLDAEFRRAPENLGLTMLNGSKLTREETHASENPLLLDFKGIDDSTNPVTDEGIYTMELDDFKDPSMPQSAEITITKTPKVLIFEDSQSRSKPTNNRFTEELIMTDIDDQELFSDNQSTNDDGLDEISDLEDSKPISKTSSSNINDVLAKYSEANEDNNVLEISDFKLKERKTIPQYSSLKNTIKLVKPLSIKPKPANAELGKPPLRMGNPMPRTPIKPVVKVTPKSTYKVAFGRTVTEKRPVRTNKEAVRPTLIKNLGGNKQRKIVGSMEFDPDLQLWKGNEAEMDEFERKVSKVVAKPKLIDHSQSSLPLKVGDMVFDPIKLVWTGNESMEDAHLFDDIETLVNSTSILNINVEKKYQAGLEKPTIDWFHKCEVSHKLMIAKWYPKAVGSNRILRDNSKCYLYEIRNVKL